MSDIKTPVQHSITSKILAACQSFSGLSIVWLMLILLFSFFENIFNSITHGFQTNFFQIMLWSLLMNLFFWIKWLFYLFFAYSVVFLLSTRLANVIFQTLIVVFFIIHAGLLLYFNTSLVLLGADLYSYSLKDIQQTLGASGSVSFLSVSAFILTIVVIIAAVRFLLPRIRFNRNLAMILPAFALLFSFLGSSVLVPEANLSTDFENSLVLNKSDYFLEASINHFYPPDQEIDIYADSYIGDYADGNTNNIEFEYVDEFNYPFLHQEAAEDVLSPFFEQKNTAPNIVILLVEGLGRAYSNEDAYLGSFTPFLDSLSEKSLYWNNLLSQGGRTFSVLPSILGSLPFAKNGFLELDKIPKHISLLNLLKFNGYHTSFYYGGDGDFDRMVPFLKYNLVDEIRDEKTFPEGYVKLPPINGFTWGYNDKELFRYFLNTRPVKKESKPILSVILTVSTHNPFLINETEKYSSLFENHLAAMKLNESEKKDHRKYKAQYTSILYMDDAIRGFINEYQKRADFANTIFFITGDHRMPEIPMSTKIDRYHVPMIIYSPLLKRTANFASVSSHYDVPPSIIAYLKNSHKLKVPSLSSWIGQGLDTNRNFQNIHSMPFMQSKIDITDFINGDYHLNGDLLFKLNSRLDEEKVNDDAKKNQMLNEFNLFKKRNSIIANGGKIIPDSIFFKYTPQR